MMSHRGEGKSENGRSLREGVKVVLDLVMRLELLI